MCTYQYTYIRLCKYIRRIVNYSFAFELFTKSNYYPVQRHADNFFPPWTILLQIFANIPRPLLLLAFRIYKSRYITPMILSTWTIAFGALVVTWFGNWGRFGLDVAIGSCSILPDVNGRSPKEFLFVVAFLIPCIAIVVCYARIFYIVRKTACKSRNRNVNASTDVVESNHEVSAARNDRSTSQVLVD